MVLGGVETRRQLLRIPWCARFFRPGLRSCGGWTIFKNRYSEPIS